MITTQNSVLYEAMVKSLGQKTEAKIDNFVPIDQRLKVEAELWQKWLKTRGQSSKLNVASSKPEVANPFLVAEPLQLVK